MDTKYAYGKIYIMRGGNETYIGSTCKTLEARKAGHKSKAAQSVASCFSALGWDNVTITLLHNYPCESKEQLRIEEQRMIDALQPTLNRYKAHLSEEQRKAYNKGHVAAYYKANKDVLIARAKAWDVANRDKLLARTHAKVECPHCKASITRYNLKRHIKNMHPNV